MRLELKMFLVQLVVFEERPESLTMIDRLREVTNLTSTGTLVEPRGNGPL